MQGDVHERRISEDRWKRFTCNSPFFGVSDIAAKKMLKVCWQARCTRFDVTDFHKANIYVPDRDS